MMQFEQTLIKYGNSVALTLPTKLREVIPGADAGRIVRISVYQEENQQFLLLSWPIPAEDHAVMKAESSE